MKRIISMLLVIAMSFSMTNVCFAAEDVNEQSNEIEVRFDDLNENEDITILPITIDDGIMTRGNVSGLFSGIITANGGVTGSFKVPQSESGKTVYFRYTLTTIDDACDYGTFMLYGGLIPYHLSVTDGVTRIAPWANLEAGTHYFRIGDGEDTTGKYNYSLQFFTY